MIPVGHKLAEAAASYAKLAHEGIRRKYTGEPYFAHCEQVAELVRRTGQLNGLVDVATAYLHDTIEDTETTVFDLAVRFGNDVAMGVLWLSDTEEGNRATRKEATRARLTRAPAWVQTVKIADMLSNWESIKEHDPDFAKVFRSEAAALMRVLPHANPWLLNELAKALT